MTARQRFILWLVGMTFAALFLLFVWPSIWEYRRDGRATVRINRITGKSQYIWPD